MSDDDKLILLKIMHDPYEAEMLRGLLETNDIKCFSENTYASNTLWHLQHALGGIRIMILSADKERADEVLNDHVVKTDATDKPWLPETRGGLFRSFLSFLVTIFSGAPTALKNRQKDDISR